MATRVLAVVACSVFVPLIMGVTAAPASAESFLPVMPDHARDTKGYTFEAQVESIRVDGDSVPLTFIAVAVSKVYANRDSERLATGRTIELYSNSCDGFGRVGLKVGDEVLMSTAYLEEAAGPSTWHTAVWRRNGARLRLLVLQQGVEDHGVWRTSDRKIAAAQTTRQALALVAPAAIGMPDTDTKPIDSARAPEFSSVFVGLASLVGLLIAVIRLRLRNVLATG
ncbi:MAG: hypothetical protein K0S97_1007 [Chloroflexota bacterium]|jgi:hypothetical protein|nr:hypothetical protein [Chloroflexota bacterium]